MKKVENLLGLVLGMKHYIDASLNEIVRIYNDTIQHIDHESTEVAHIRKDYLFGKTGLVEACCMFWWSAIHLRCLSRRYT